MIYCRNAKLGWEKIWKAYYSFCFKEKERIPCSLSLQMWENNEQEFHQRNFWRNKKLWLSVDGDTPSAWRSYALKYMARVLGMAWNETEMLVRKASKLQILWRSRNT